MRTRLLALLAAAALVAAGLVSAGSAVAGPAFNTDWGLCTSPSDTYCIVSATANGASTFPGQDPSDTNSRDYPWVNQVDANLIDFGAWHDNGTHTTITNDVNPSVVYRLVIRTGSFFPREMDATARNGNYSISHSATTGWTATIQFQPTAIHQTSATACSYDGGCGGTTTKATPDLDINGFATGSLQTLATSGLSRAEIAARTGMFTTTSAQDSYLFWNIDLGVLEVRMANPHLEADGTTPVTDGTYDAFIPDAFLTGIMGVPDPTALPGFTLAVTGSAAPSSSSFIHVAGGIRIHFAGVSFSRPTYRLRPRPTPPGRPRAVGVRKTSLHTAKVTFRRPLLNGGRAITYYQARCQRLRGTWHYARRSASPIYVTRLPRGRVYCEVRAHNAIGYGRWTTAVHS